jgi:hypothetical protein
MSDKLFDKYLNFSRSYEIAVNVYDSETSQKSCRAKIVLNKNLYPRIEFEKLSDAISFRDRADFYCRGDGVSYLLIDCETTGATFYPKYIVKSEINFVESFSGFYVLFRGFSEWIIGDKNIVSDGDKLVIQHESRKFSLELDNAYKISNEYWFSNGNSKKASATFNEYCLIKVESTSGVFSLDKTRELIYDLKRIFSLLSGVNIDVEFVTNLSGGSDEASFYFASDQKNDELDFNNVFFSPEYLFKYSKIEDALKQYYLHSKSKFNDVWNRLLGMLEYQGYWEFRILGIVALLDKVVSVYADSINSKLISKDKFSGLKKEIEKTIYEFNLDAQGCIGEEHKSLYKSLIQKLNDGFVNRHYSTFKEKFDLLISSVDPDVKEIINLTEDQFKHLKRIRDAIAHGETPETKLKGDITIEGIIVAKVTLILLYLAYKDLSFNEIDFIEMIDKFDNKLINRAKLNHVALDYKLKKVVRIKLRKADYDLLEKHNNSHCVFRFLKSKNEYIFVKSLTKKLNEIFYNFYYRPKDIKSVEAYVETLVSPRVIKKIAYVNSVQIVCGEQIKPLKNGTIFLNFEEHMFEGLNVYKRITGE